MDRQTGAVRVVFDGRMHVSYMQAYVESLDPDAEADHMKAFAGQINGLLGAAEPNALNMTTGLHTGDVGFRLVIADQALPLGDEWEDIVETPFTPIGPTAVVQWGGEELCEFELPAIPHRVRYSVRQMDEGRDTDVVMSDEPVVDRYELAFWPADPAPEQILRTTSKSAAYWHDARHFEKSRRRQIRTWWGDEPPSERLIDIPQVRWLVDRARDLAEAVAAADPGAQRAVAVWAARRAGEEASIDQVAEFAEALQIQGRNETLPPGFERRTIVEEARLLTEKVRSDRTRGEQAAWQPDHSRSWAIRTLCEADREDPLRAALETLISGAQVFEHDEVFLSEAHDTLVAAVRAGNGTAPDPRHDLWHGDFMARGIWGDHPIHPRLVEVFAHELTKFDPALAERLADADPDLQRAVARWSARRACTAAGLADALPEVALALDHLDRGEALPPPFDDEVGQWRLLDKGPRDSSATWSIVVVEESPLKPQRKTRSAGEAPKGKVPAGEALTSTVIVDGSTCSRAHCALDVIRAAAEGDPLAAATRALWSAAGSFGDEYRQAVLNEASALFLDNA